MDRLRLDAKKNAKKKEVDDYESWMLRREPRAANTKISSVFNLTQEDFEPHNEMDDIAKDRTHWTWIFIDSCSDGNHAGAIHKVMKHREAKSDSVLRSVDGRAIEISGVGTLHRKLRCEDGSIKNVKLEDVEIIPDLLGFAILKKCPL